MNRAVIGAVLLAACAGHLPAQQVAQPPASPQVSLSQGDALVKLARTAMAAYLASRTPADSVPVPADLKDLGSRGYGAALTLRRRGSRVSRSVEAGEDTCGNVIRAALRAMRSPLLGDSVTQGALDGLTVELELLGQRQRIEEANVTGAIMPGLTGLSASRGLDDTVLLPSEVYARGLQADAAQRLCLSQLPLTAANASLPVRWSLFGTQHYVGYADGATTWLHRGKTLMPAGLIDANALRSAAVAIGEFLIRNQGKDGQLRVPDGDGPALPDHLYGAFALARLAKATGRKDFAYGANAAMAYAMRFVKQEGELAQFVNVPQEHEQASAALMVLAIGEMPPSEAGGQIGSRLVAGLQRAAAVGRDANALGRAWTLKTRCLAVLAAGSAGGLEPNSPLGLMREAPTDLPADAETAMWVVRAGMAPSARQGPASPAWPAPLHDGRPMDLAGGLAAKGDCPSTVVTALAAVNLAAGRTWPGVTAPSGPRQAGRAAEEIALAARRFCYQMTYKPREAYFADEPDRWLGGVRSSPQGAQIGLPACAAAIEALLGGYERV